MSITRLTTNGLTGTKYDTVSADNYYMEPIATTLLAGTQASISFTNIPQGYKHLQLRALAQTNRGTYAKDELKMNINGDTGSNYAYHSLVGTGAAAAAGAGTSQTYCYMDASATATAAGSIFGTMIIDILDYSNVYKFKTLRMLFGYDLNGTLATNTGSITFQSNLWMNTAGVTSLTLAPINGTAFNTNSRFSLYGIKG